MSGEAIYLTFKEAQELSILLDEYISVSDDPGKEIEKIRLKIDFKFGWRKPEQKDTP